MTPLLRYALAIGLPVLAALIGFAITSPPASDDFNERLAAWPEIDAPADYSNSVDRFVSDLSAMYLFGRVEEQIAATAISAEIEEAPDRGLDGYAMVAHFGADDAPNASLTDPSGAFFSVREGDIVGEAWVVTSIDKDMIVLSKDGEFQTLVRTSAIDVN